MTPIWKGLPGGLKNRIRILNTFDKLNKWWKQKKGKKGDAIQSDQMKGFYTQVVIIIYSICSSQSQVSTSTTGEDLAGRALSKSQGEPKSVMLYRFQKNIYRHEICKVDFVCVTRSGNLSPFSTGTVPAGACARPPRLRSKAAAGECPGENGPKPQPEGTGAIC